jgi:ADP-dependent NAD(P)H-hydrate dehydratase / NAD(P)H-hydrate epimerase
MSTAAWAKRAILTVAEMRTADKLAAGEIGGSFPLMRAAGLAIARAARESFPHASGFDVLCGPGNNGGDGYVAATELLRAGLDVAVWKLGEASGKDAVQAASQFTGAARSVEEFAAQSGRVVIDALFGAGLSRPLDGAAAAALQRTKKTGAPVVSVDLPSGIGGDGGEPLGEAFPADLTVTFARLKAAHLLYPARALCGRIVVADIGISDGVIETIAPQTFENGPALWREVIPWPEGGTHKYRRGHLAVFSGPAHATGAARLSAAAGARAGAGAVTVVSPTEALAANAAHLTAIMLRPVDTTADLEALMGAGRFRAAVLGPGFGDLRKAAEFALALLARRGEDEVRLVLDADGITAFRDEPSALFTAARGGGGSLVLTPHDGEFARLFPDLHGAPGLSKIEKARRAAERAGAVVLLKGPDTVVAEPSGRAVVNSNATPFLATAGSGDALAGICGGLLAQGMPTFEAVCAAAWIHAEAGRRFGVGLTADDLPDAMLPVLRDLAP